MKAVRSHRLALGALAVGASLALPAAALASGGVGVNAGVNVKAHVLGSQAALKLAIKLEAKGKLDASFAAFLKSRTELGKARASVVALLKGALTPAARADAAKALALLGQLEDTNITKLTSLLDDVTGPFQKAVAKANLNDTSARDRAIGILQALLPGLPSVMQGPISNAISGLMAGNGAQVQTQASLLANAGLTPDIKKLISQAIGTGLQGQAQSLVGIQSILGVIPGPVQQQLQSALDLAKGQTKTAFDMVEGVLKTAPVPPAVSSIVTGVMNTVQGVLDTVFGMFGQVTTGGTPGGTTGITGGSTDPITGVTNLIPDLGGIIKCVFPAGVPSPTSVVGGVLPGFDPTKIVGCLTTSLGVASPTGIVNCIFPNGMPTGTTLPAGFDPTSIATCVIKSVQDPTGILKNLPDPSGIIKCVFPNGLPSPTNATGALAGIDPSKIVNCVMGGLKLDPTGIISCVFPGGTPSAGSILPVGFDPFSIVGCVMDNVPFMGGTSTGSIVPDPTQLVGSLLGNLNPFNLLNGLLGVGANGGAFLGITL